MARNGSGTYTLPAGNPVTTGTTISSTWANNTLNDIGNAMTASLAYDGQTTPVANLPMGGYLHTGVANATARTNYASAGQVQDSTLQYLTSVSGTNTITALAPISMGALAAGQTFRFIVAATNTGSVTLNINSIGAKSITKNGATALSSGDLVINSMVEIIYDGTQFQVLNPNVISSLGTMATQNANAVAITGGTISGLSSPLPVASGGTGAATLTTNSVLLGNGTSAISTIAPSTSGNVLTSDGTTWSSQPNPKLISGTAQATTSGTSISFTGIPSGVKRITVMLSAINTSGSNNVVIKVGTSGGTVSSGYVVVGSNAGQNALPASGTASNAFFLDYGLPTSASLRYGIATLALLNASTNLWAFSATIGEAISGTYFLMAGGGSVALSSVLTSVTLTTSNGIDTFSGGSINILYE